jgi:glycosyltransferase involved in cell wall biosynthesis
MARALATNPPQMAETRPLILIPSYNTGRILRETVAATLTSQCPVWVVIDGSTDGSPDTLRDLETPANPGFRILFLETNSGKGAALLHALRQAVDDGFTHVLTMDSDGQHPATHIPEFLKLSATHPEAAVFGKPVFDSSAPAIRVNGRKLSNFWANLETLGWGIGDSLFGMRLYPAAELLAVMRSTRHARRFDFEPEAAVRLAWRGVPIINLPTPVRYPGVDEGGVSQFRYFRDNRLLIWMHLRLLFGFLTRLPSLISRGGNPLSPS